MFPPSRAKTLYMLHARHLRIDEVRKSPSTTFIDLSVSPGQWRTLFIPSLASQLGPSYLFPPLPNSAPTNHHRSHILRNNQATKHQHQQNNYPLTRTDQSIPTMASHQQQPQQSQSQTQSVGFEDYLPVMAERLGEEGLMEELASGFRLLQDPARMSDDNLRGMLAEGDFDGDGALSEMEFCVLMVRLSPELMDEPRRWLDDAVAQASQFLFTS